GFEMHLSGQVPGRIRRWLPENGAKLLPPEPPVLWAVHAGGRSILDAVQQGLRLEPDALRYSRDILRDYGNMSSATLMFVLEKILSDHDARGPGLAMAFGPGLTVETFAFHRP
ncbi:MAG: 3-oxoacyl-[acyl-carrier-protein] synthase III C-terminal domain-containing protein, partial [Rhodopila sp.]|nr:3-oxoacyl-[acyl-carrier-protein] synthase III C-terminal domain-containing protein [Rhodopila sp.]